MIVPGGARQCSPKSPYGRFPLRCTGSSPVFASEDRPPKEECIVGHVHVQRDLAKHQKGDHAVPLIKSESEPYTSKQANASWATTVNSSIHLGPLSTSAGLARVSNNETQQAVPRSVGAFPLHCRPFGNLTIKSTAPIKCPLP